jgi:hypothetical protein
MGYIASEWRITRKDIKGGGVGYFKFMRMIFKTDETREELQRAEFRPYTTKAPSVTFTVT